MIRSIAFAILVAGCSLAGISRERAIEIALAEAMLDQVLLVAAERTTYENLENLKVNGREGGVWIVTLEGWVDRCVPGGGGCRLRNAEATYYIDLDTGDIVGVTMGLSAP